MEFIKKSRVVFVFFALGLVCWFLWTRYQQFPDTLYRKALPNINIMSAQSEVRSDKLFNKVESLESFKDLKLLHSPIILDSCMADKSLTNTDIFTHPRQKETGRSKHCDYRQIRYYLWSSSTVDLGHAIEQNKTVLGLAPDYPYEDFTKGAGTFQVIESVNQSPKLYIGFGEAADTYHFSQTVDFIYRGRFKDWSKIRRSDPMVSDRQLIELAGKSGVVLQIVTQDPYFTFYDTN